MRPQLSKLLSAIRYPLAHAKQAIRTKDKLTIVCSDFFAALHPARRLLARLFFRQTPHIPRSIMNPFLSALPFRKLSGRKMSNPFVERESKIQPAILWSPWSPWILTSVRPQKDNNRINIPQVPNRSNGYANSYDGSGKAMSDEHDYQTTTTFITSNWTWATEFHGMTSLMSARTWKGQTFWLIVILTCLTVGIYSTYTLIAEYTGTPTATLITLEPVEELLFPKITFCPKIPDAIQQDKIIASMRNSALPPIDRATAANLTAFAIAGSGFDNLETLVDRWSSAEISMYSRLYDMWRGNASVHEFFTRTIEGSDYRCEDFFAPNGCVVSGRQRNCCEIFEPKFVMRRGRCFSSISLMQTNVDEIGKIVISLNRMPSRLVDSDGLQPQTVVYLSDYIPPIPDYPRYYLNPNEWNRMRFRLRQINQIHKADNNCTADESVDGPNLCFVNNWLNETIIKPLNCSLPYLLDYAKNKTICHPEQIVRNYEAAIHQRSAFENVQQCKPSCERWEYQTSIHTNGAQKPFQGYGFRLEASYMDMVYEKYQEVRTTTFPGFVSQIGGQLSLFLGISIITFVQFVLHAVFACYRFIKYKRRRSTSKK